VSETESRVSDEADAGEEQAHEIESGEWLCITSHDGGESEGDVGDGKRERLRTLVSNKSHDSSTDL
jgi:hypothetical protein